MIPHRHCGLLPQIRIIPREESEWKITIKCDSEFCFCKSVRFYGSTPMDALRSGIEEWNRVIEMEQAK